MDLLNILLGGTVTMFLAGIIWTTLDRRLDHLREGLDHRVTREVCVERHEALAQDIAEIRDSLARITTALDQINTTLAYQRGRSQSPN